MLMLAYRRGRWEKLIMYRLLLGTGGRVQSPNKVVQKTERTLKNTHTPSHNQTNDGFRNIKKHPFSVLMYFHTVMQRCIGNFVSSQRSTASRAQQEYQATEVPLKGCRVGSGHTIHRHLPMYCPRILRKPL